MDVSPKALALDSVYSQRVKKFQTAEELKSDLEKASKV